MSLESVRTFLAQHAPDVPLIVGAASLATVEQAAAGLADARADRQNDGARP